MAIPVAPRTPFAGLIWKRRARVLWRQGLMLLVLLAWSGGSTARLDAASGADDGCFVEQSNAQISIGHNSFLLELDTSKGIRAKKVKNRLTGATVELGSGHECSLRFSAAISRVELLGWKQASGGGADNEPDREEGFANGYYKTDFDGSGWDGTFSPWSVGLGWASGNKRSPNPDGYNWYRVRFDLPNAKGEPVTFGLGGGGLFDFGQHRFFCQRCSFGAARFGKTGVGGTDLDYFRC